MLYGGAEKYVDNLGRSSVDTRFSQEKIEPINTFEWVRIPLNSPS
jgi:hypothetical protein